MKKIGRIAKTIPVLIGLVALISCNSTSGNQIKTSATVSQLSTKWDSRIGQFPANWNTIDDISFSPSGTSLAVSDFNTVYITTMKQDEIPNQISGIRGKIAWNTTASLLAGNSFLNNAVIYDFSQQTSFELGPRGMDYATTPIAWSPVRDQIVMVQGTAVDENGYFENYSLAIWDVATRQIVKDLGLISSGFPRQISWKGNWVLVIAQGQGIFNAVTGVKEWTMEGTPMSGELSPSGNQAAIAYTDSNNSRIEIMDTITKQIVLTIPLMNSVPNTLKWNASGTLIAGGTLDGVTNIWDTQTGNLVRTLRKQNSKITDVEWKSSLPQLAVASSEIVEIFNTQTGGLIARAGYLDPTARKNNVYSLAYHPNKPEILEVGRDSQNIILSAIDGIRQEKFIGQSESVYGAAYNPDGTKFATASSDGTTMIWDSSNNTPIGTLNGHAYTVRGVAWGINTIATASWDSTAKLWNPNTLEEIATIQHTDFVNAVALNPDSTQVATGSSDRTLKISNSTDGTLIRNITAPAAILGLAWNSNGTQIAVAATDKNVYIYESATGVLIKTLTGHIGAVRAVLWTKDNSAIVSGADDGNLKLWDVATGTEVYSTKPDSGYAIFALALSPNGQTVVAGLANGLSSAYQLQ